MRILHKNRISLIAADLLSSWLVIIVYTKQITNLICLTVRMKWLYQNMDLYLQKHIVFKIISEI